MSPRAAAVADSLLSVLVELSFARDLSRLTEVTRKAVRRLTGADGVTFVLRDGDRSYYVDEDAIAPLWKGQRFPLDRCVSGWVMLNRTTAVIPDIYVDQRVPHEAYRPTFVRSILMVPVRESDPVAAIGVYWAFPHEATQGERDIVQAIANGAALAMANVQLVQELEATAAREHAARVAAERANQLTERFLATVSHELRTPLGVISGWLWRFRQPGVTRELLEHGIGVAERNVATQARMVDDLLEASRAVSGTLQLRRALTDLNEVSRAVAERERATAEAKGIRLAVETPANPVLVDGDRERLEEVVRHLVDNAVKFTPPDGQVVVQTVREGQQARVVVRDTGIGMTPDVASLVFQRFWQRDSSSTREFGGLGLGLTLVDELVKLHGGSVLAESAGAGLGSRFTVQLPVAAVLAEQSVAR